MYPLCFYDAGGFQTPSSPELEHQHTERGVCIPLSSVLPSNRLHQMHASHRVHTLPGAAPGPRHQADRAGRAAQGPAAASTAAQLTGQRLGQRGRAGGRPAPPRAAGERKRSSNTCGPWCWAGGRLGARQVTATRSPLHLS